MHNTTPQVFLIAKTSIHSRGIEDWLHFLGADLYQWNRAPSDAENLVVAAAKRCYMSFEPGLNPNVKAVRNDTAAFLENILKSGHGSVLEHASFSFAIENVSRVFTGEMNRHRAGMAISEGSMRFIRFTDIPFWMPFSFMPDENDPPAVIEKKERSREILLRSFQTVEADYTELVALWGMDSLPDFKSKKMLTSAMRRIIGMGVSSGGVWTGNIRALRHIFEMRCAEPAEEEIQFVAGLMLEKMLQECPIIFSDFHKNEKGFWTSTYKKV